MPQIFPIHIVKCRAAMESYGYKTRSRKTKNTDIQILICFPLYFQNEIWIFLFFLFLLVLPKLVCLSLSLFFFLKLSLALTFIVPFFAFSLKLLSLFLSPHLRSLPFCLLLSIWKYSMCIKDFISCFPIQTIVCVRFDMDMKTSSVLYRIYNSFNGRERILLLSAIDDDSRIYE